MSYGRQGLRALGLSVLAALGLMAFTAAGAQAEGGEFLIAEKTFAELEIASEAIEGVQEGASKLLILKLNLILKCGKVAIDGHILLLGHGKATIAFSNCKVLDLQGEEAVCTVEPFEANSLSLVFLHNEKPYILLSPQAGLTFTTVVTEECVLPEQTTVSGHIVASIKEADSDSNPLLVTLDSSSLELFPEHVLKYGNHNAHLTASANVELAGKYESLDWGATEEQPHEDPLSHPEEWLIGKKTLKELGIAKESISVQNETKDGFLLILKLNLKLKCLKESAAGFISPLGHGHATLLYEECWAEDSAGEKAAGTVLDIEAKVLAQVILHGEESHPYILFSPLDGLTFATIFAHESPLPEKAEVKGSAVAHLTWPLEDKVKQLILTNTTSLELFPEHVFKYGNHSAHLTTDAEVWLTGDNEGETWGAT